MAPLAVTMKWVMKTNQATIHYQHSQRGTVILVTLLGAAAVLVGLGLAKAELKVLWVSLPVLLGCSWLFHSLTIEITDCELRWRFGPGLIGKRVPLGEIIAAAPVRTGPSWGIHWSPGKGWLYNVSGFDAVAITLRSGKHLAIGTDEPAILAGALNHAMQRSPPSGLQSW